jgi:hypothetical protein
MTAFRHASGRWLAAWATAGRLAATDPLDVARFLAG